jgi:hypothetical protein
MNVVVSSVKSTPLGNAVRLADIASADTGVSQIANPG